MLKLEMQHACDYSNIPSEALFTSWANAALEEKSKDLDLIIRFVNQDESSDLNENYRNKNYPTNVLSFVEEEIPGYPATSLGTLVMCPDVIVKEASELAIPIDNHWAHLTIHGVLHLQGYDHIDDKEADIMEAKEIEILANFNIGNPYEIKDKDNE